MKGIPKRIGTVRDLEHLEQMLPSEEICRILQSINSTERTRLGLKKTEIKDWIARVRAEGRRAVENAQTRDDLHDLRIRLTGALEIHRARAAQLRPICAAKRAQVVALLDAGLPLEKIAPVKDAEDRIRARFDRQLQACCRVNSEIAGVDHRLKQMEG